MTAHFHNHLDPGLIRLILGTGFIALQKIGYINGSQTDGVIGLSKGLFRDEFIHSSLQKASAQHHQLASTDQKFPLRAVMFVCSFLHLIKTSSTCSTTNTIEEAIRKLDPSQRWSVQKVTMSRDKGKALANAIEAGNAIAVSDGSFKSEFGTAAWTVRGSSDSDYMTGVNVTPGTASKQSAFCSKLSGI